MLFRSVEAGLAIAEMIASLSKPTVSLVLGGSHSIGGPMAVAADYSYIVPTGTMIVHPVRSNGMFIGTIQSYRNMEKDVYKRQVLIIQNDVGNRHSPTVICAAITSKMNKSKLPTHIEINAKEYHIVKNSVILLEQIRTIDKQRLREYVCHVDYSFMKKIEEALKISLEIST